MFRPSPTWSIWPSRAIRSSAPARSSVAPPMKTKATNPGLKVFLARPKSFAAEPSGGGAAAVAELAVPDTGAAGAARIVDRHVEEATGPKLDEAAVVVAGGRGLG